MIVNALETMKCARDGMEDNEGTKTMKRSKIVRQVPLDRLIAMPMVLLVDGMKYSSEISARIQVLLQHMVTRGLIRN